MAQAGFESTKKDQTAFFYYWQSREFGEDTILHYGEASGEGEASGPGEGEASGESDASRRQTCLVIKGDSELLKPGAAVPLICLLLVESSHDTRPRPGTD